ncbi:hypothetical protein [Roseovarius rhodophyticola]|uniref:ABC transmembrane type-1 domain-containing protein n=1 Tax=Roseovarius rhodophyticola TaxID=3080827 RepID=A0ABZ2TJL4_9RHOB|nr:hypothetical protein [Roseovarius sp. W115]MDV2930261.1 hypothetical protein [Roseovarius sp. W115]
MIKEAELLRTEALQCIGNVRRLTGFVTSVAGAGIPLLAALLNIGPTSDVKISTLSELNTQIIENAIIVQMVMVSISITCVCFLMIYTGVFTQIFVIAKYFREYLSIEINKIVTQPDDGITPVFHWEDWLQKSRKHSGFKVGDIELAIEPLMMTAFSVIYAGLACYVSYISTNAWITYSISGVVGFLCLASLVKFFRTLSGSLVVSEAVADPETEKETVEEKSEET